MNPLSRRLLTAIVATTVWALGLPAAARAADWQALLGNSPFGQSSTSAAPAATGELEFRGVVQEENVYLVNLYNPSTKTSQWIPVKGRAPGLEVQAYDANADRVSISLGGRTLSLPLKQAHVALLAAAPAPAAAAPNDGPPESPEDKARDERRAEIREMMRARRENGGPGPGAFRDLPPESLQRIQELRRRRAGANGPATGGTPAATVPAEPPQ